MRSKHLYSFREENKTSNIYNLYRRLSKDRTTISGMSFAEISALHFLASYE